MKALPEEQQVVNVEDIVEPEADLGEIEEVQSSAEDSQPQAPPLEAPAASAEEGAEAELMLEPSDEVSEEPPIALAEEAPAEAPVLPVDEMPAEEPVLPVEEMVAEAPASPVGEVAEDAPVMLAEEVVAEAQVAKVGETVIEAPRPPVDLGELPPAPEEPMQLAATWEFVGMAETGHVPEAPAQDRGLELETSVSTTPDDTGSPQDEVALAPTLDFVPQWQPEEAAKSEPAAPAGTVSSKPERSPEMDLAEEEPERTGLFGVVRVAPEASGPQPGASAGPAVTGKYGVASVEPVTTGKYGIRLPERSTTGKYGVGPGTPVVELGGEEARAGEEPGGDQQALTAEPASPATTAPAGPPEPDDPFASFSTQEATKEKPSASPVPAPTDAAGSGPDQPVNPFDVNPFDVNPFDEGSGSQS